MKILTNKQGFTMIELLMVIIVIGILTSLAVPQYQQFMEKSRTVEAKQVMSSIKSAQELFFLEHGTYGSEAQINGNYITYPTAGNTTLFTYAITAQNNMGYTVVATRTMKDGGFVGDMGGFVWNRPIQNATWSGLFV